MREFLGFAAANVAGTVAGLLAGVLAAAGLMAVGAPAPVVGVVFVGAMMLVGTTAGMIAFDAVAGERD